MDEQNNELSSILSAFVGDESPEKENDDDSLVDALFGSDAEKDQDDGKAGDSDKDGATTWADALGLPDEKVHVDESGALKGIVVKVDGVEETVPIAELIKGYQTEKSYTQKSQALAEEKKQFDTHKQTHTVELERRVQSAEALLGLLHQKYIGDYQSIPWEQLKATDPGKFLSTLSEFQAREAELKNVFGQLQAQRGFVSEEQSALQREQFGAYVADQVKALIEDNPEWADQEKFKSALLGMQEFAVKTYGFTDDEFNGVADARLIKLCRDAMKYRLGVEGAKRKLDRSLPSFTKGGSRVPHKVPTVAQKLEAKAKATPQKSPQARVNQDAAIAELMTDFL